MSEKPKLPPTEMTAVFDIKSIFGTLGALGYSVKNIRLIQSVEPQEGEEDQTILSWTFDVTGIPVIKEVGDEVIVKIGTCSVNIFSVKTETPDYYFVEDIIASNFIVDTEIAQFKSFVLENIFHSLLKTYLIVETEKT